AAAKAARADAAGHASGPLEAVADAPDGLDQGGMSGVVLQLGPEPLHGYVHQARIAEVVIVPHALEQDLASEHLTGSAGHLQQEPELGGREREILAVLPGGDAGRIDLEWSHRGPGLL